MILMVLAWNSTNFMIFVILRRIIKVSWFSGFYSDMLKTTYDFRNSGVEYLNFHGFHNYGMEFYEFPDFRNSDMKYLFFKWFSWFVRKLLWILWFSWFRNGIIKLLVLFSWFLHQLKCIAGFLFFFVESLNFQDFRNSGVEF